METFEIRVGTEEMGFSAAHFITYDGGQCEPLHGHDYRVTVRIVGAADADALVYDFVALREEGGRLARRLDHRTLLPDSNPHLEVERGDGIVTVRRTSGGEDGGVEYRFPEEAVILLPVPNTTAEMLARWFAGKLAETVADEGDGRLRRLEVEVEEAPGQSATCSRTL